MMLPCIVCGKKLEPASGAVEELDNQPYEGTAFITYGHYGSTVFDPMDGSYIEITVCDNCLKKAAHMSEVAEGRTHEPKTFRQLSRDEVPALKYWNPWEKGGQK